MRTECIKKRAHEDAQSRRDSARGKAPRLTSAHTHVYAVGMSACAIEKHAGGRPCEYRTETARVIAERYEQGESFLDISDDEDMPDSTTINAWMERFPEFSRMLSRARPHHVRRLMERALRKADRAHDSHSANAAKVYLGAAVRWAQALDRDTWGAKEEREVTHYQRMDDNALKAKLIEKLASDPALLDAARALASERKRVASVAAPREIEAGGAPPSGAGGGGGLPDPYSGTSLRAAGGESSENISPPVDTRDSAT